MTGREIDLFDLVRDVQSKRANALADGRLFNLFDALSIREREVIHSRVIATLLSPDSPHGMKELPYQIFIRKLSYEFPGLRLSSSGGGNCKVCVSCEHYIGPVSKDYESGGSIDILIRDKKLSIAIENKIYADDQPKQLYRYAKWLKQNECTAFLIYLTLDGHQPSENSVNSKVREFGTTEQADFPMYVRLTYRFVANWIRSLMDETGLSVSSPSHMFLMQYFGVVQSILNKNEDELMINALKGYFAEAELIAKNYPVARKNAIVNMLRQAFGEDMEMAESFARWNAPSHNPCRIYSGKTGKMSVCLSWFGTEPYSNPVVGIAFSNATNQSEREELGRNLRQTFTVQAIELPSWGHCEFSEWWPVYYKGDMTVSGRFLDDDKEVLQMENDVKMIYDYLKSVVDKIEAGKDHTLQEARTLS